MVSDAVAEGTAEAAANGTLAGYITQGDRVIHGLVAAAHGEIVLHNGSVLVEDGVHPVGAFTQRIGIVEHGGIAGIELAFVHHHGILGRVQNGRLAPGILHTVGEVVGNLGLTLGSFLGGNKHNAMGTTGAVNGRGGCILEDLDTLDVIRIQVVDATGSQAIDNIERCTSIDGTDTTDTDLCTGIRSTGALDNGNTGGHTLQDIVHAGLSGGLEVLGGDAGNGSGYHRFLLHTITDDDGLFQHLGIVLEDDSQCLIGRYRKLTAFIAQASHFHDGTGLDAEGESSVRTGHGTVGGSLLDDESAHDGLVCIVQNCTLKGNTLRQSNQAQSQGKD